MDINKIEPSKTGQDIHHPNCFGCGPNNPKGLAAEFTFDPENGEVRFPFTGDSTREGAPGYFHGGILATLLDESQGDLCFHLGHFVMTDHLNMKYHKATPLYEAIQIRCWITAVRKRRLYTRGTIHSASGELLVSSNARWYDLGERTLKRMFRGTAMDRSQLYDVLELNRKRAKAIRKRIRESRT